VNMSSEWAAPIPPPCVGCGKRHGGVNAELNCMRQEIAFLRSRLRPIAQAINAFYAIGTSKGGMFEVLRMADLNAKRRHAK
jgi:hypothetical protein